MSRENERSLLLHDCAVVHMPTAAAATATPPKKKREPTHFNKLSSDIIFNIAQFASDPTTPSGLFELMTLVRMGEDLKHLYYLSDAREYELTPEQLASDKIKRDEKGARYFSGNALYPGLTSFVRKQLFIRDSLRDQSPVLLKLLRDYPEWFHKDITLGNSIFSLVQKRLGIPAFSYTPQKTGEELAKTNADFREMRLSLAYYFTELSYFFANNPLHSSTSHRMGFLRNHPIALSFLLLTMIFVFLFLFLPRTLILSDQHKICHCDDAPNSQNCEDINGTIARTYIGFTVEKICHLFETAYCPRGSIFPDSFSLPPKTWNLNASNDTSIYVNCSAVNQIAMMMMSITFGFSTLCVALCTAIEEKPRDYLIETPPPVDGRMSTSDLEKIIVIRNFFRQRPLGAPPERNKFFATPSCYALIDLTPFQVKEIADLLSSKKEGKAGIFKKIKDTISSKAANYKKALFTEEEIKELKNFLESNGRRDLSVELLMSTPTRSRSVAAGPASAAAVM